MAIEAKVIADSTHGSGVRLTTMVLKYPRFIHSEMMTHRVFSRNAASSRAIPVKTMIQRIKDDPAMPIYWGKNQPGMQARGELDDVNTQDLPSPRHRVKQIWLRARDQAIMHVEQLMELGLHKQIANRILEPWMDIEVVVTATEWANFYALRNHPDAQPEMQALASTMLEAHKASTPEYLTPGEWHLPFVTCEDQRTYHYYAKDDEYLFAKVSAARCARVSYLKHDGGTPSLEDDLKLYDRLMGGEIKHASPTEHQARVPEYGELDDYDKLPSHLQSNLYQWVQHRKLIPGENIHSYEKFK